MTNLFYRQLIEPISKDDDRRRQERVLNIVLTTLGGLSIVAFILPITALFLNNVQHNTSSIISGAVFMVAIFGLHRLSRLGYSQIVAYILVTLLGLVVIELTFLWSFELPVAELIYALTIVTAGVLLNTKSALIMTFLISLGIFGISVGQINHLIYARTDWADKPFVIGDAIAYLVIFCMTGLIAWLGNREIDQSLKLARASKNALQLQRDRLEVMVIERTQQLEAEQLAHMLELQRLAEYGRITAGLIHDLSNPLTAISLNIDLLQNSHQPLLLTKIRKSLRFLQRYLNAARRQLESQNVLVKFSVIDELQQLNSILDHKAKLADVRVELTVGDDNLTLFGDSVKFSQIMANLMSNAVESYPANHVLNQDRVVTVDVAGKSGDLTIKVNDHGSGISKKDQSTIFMPFYTTKSEVGRGIGIGLVIVKEYVENDFNGEITFQSRTNNTTFTVKLRDA